MHTVLKVFFLSIAAPLRAPTLDKAQLQPLPLYVYLPSNDQSTEVDANTVNYKAKHETY